MVEDRKHSSDQEFENTEAGSLVTNVTVGTLKKGGYVMLKDKPCKILELNTSKVGKHGAAKTKIVGSCIFTGTKCEQISPTGNNIEVPNVDRATYVLTNITDDGYVELLSEKGEMMGHVKCPEDNNGGKAMRDAMEAGHTVDVVVISAMGTDMVTEHRVKEF